MVVVGGGIIAHRFCKLLLDVFIHFYVRIISSPVSVCVGRGQNDVRLIDHLNFSKAVLMCD